MKDATDGAVWHVHVGSSSFGHDQVHVHLLYLQNPKCRARRIPTPTLPVHTEFPCIIPSTSTGKSSLRSHSRRETRYIGYAHACGPEGARETDHSTLVRYSQIQVQEECETSSSLSWVWKYCRCSGTGRSRRGKMRRRSPLIAAVRSLRRSLWGGLSGAGETDAWTRCIDGGTACDILVVMCSRSASSKAWASGNRTTGAFEFPVLVKSRL